MTELNDLDIQPLTHLGRVFWAELEEILNRLELILAEPEKEDR